MPIRTVNIGVALSCAGWILAAGKEKRVLSSVRLGAPMDSTPVAANGVLFVATMKRLYALQRGGHAESVR